MMTSRPLRFVCLAFLGCAHPTALGPSETLDAWSSALGRRDATAVRQLLDRNGQASFDEPSILELLETHGEELAATRTPSPDSSVSARAVYALGGGGRAVALFEEGRWKLSGIEELGLPVLRNPEDAVHELRRCLRSPELSRLARVLAQEPRTMIVGSVERFLEDSNDELSWRITVEGDTANVHTLGGWRVSLKRESGEWRVDEVSDE